MVKIDPDRLERELLHMRELIATDPAVRTRFDTNGDGEIDGSEWQAVRQLVLRRLMREAIETQAARAVAAEQESGLELPPDVRAADLPQARDGADGSAAEAVYERDVVAPETGSESEGLFQFARWTLVRQTARLAPLDMREYRILDQLRRPVGEVLGRGGPGDDVLEFDIRDSLTQTSYVLQRTRKPPNSRVLLLGPDGVELARVKQESRTIGSACRVTWPTGELVVQRKLWDPWSWTIDAGGPAGEVELDSLETGATLRVYTRASLPLEARHGLLAAALLIDLLDDGGNESEHVETGVKHAFNQFMEMLGRSYY